jgi:Holliday junction resolvase
MGLLEFLFGKSEPPPSNREDWEDDIQIYQKTSGHIIERNCKLPSYCVELYTGKHGHKYFYNKNRTKFSFINGEIICDTQIGEWHFDRYACFCGYSHEYNINLSTNTYTLTSESKKFGTHLSTDSSLINILIMSIKKDYNYIFGDFQARNVDNKPLISDLKDKFFLPKHYSEKDIRSMSWRYFEEFTEHLFEYNGFVTQLTPPSNDEGKDIIAYKNGEKYFIECKHWKKGSSVGREYLQKLVGAAAGSGVTNVIFITTCSFHDNAKVYAKEINKSNMFHLELWNMNKLLEVANSIPGNKYQEQKLFN